MVLNGWATEEEISTLGDTDKKSRLVEGLYLRLNPDIHSKPDLGKRDPISDQGGLCGLAAMSHALGSTVATSSVLRTLDYDRMREEMASEVFISRQKLPEYMDLDLLEAFYECKQIMNNSSLYSKAYLGISFLICLLQIYVRAGQGEREKLSICQ